jgi:nitroreductase
MRTRTACPIGKHYVNGNSLKLYDKAFTTVGSVLRAEMTLQQEGDFRVYRCLESDPQGKPAWRVMRRGVADLLKDVPVNLIYVSDYAKIPRGTDEDRRFYSGTHTGFISQNVYLFCASEGLATVVRGLIDRDAMAKVMRLRPGQHVTFAQSVGFPKK